MNRRRSSSLLAVMLALGALAIAACGGDNDSGGSSTAAAKTTGNGVDASFADEMVAHHRAAVAMGKIAQQRAKTGFVRNLASDVVETQTSEISVMRGIRRALPQVSKADLGMDPKSMGMDMDPSMLRDATPFDREFVDMMIPHHQGAIRMARVELEKGDNDALRGIANAVIKAQTREIKAMNAFRADRYGAPSPAGGVPAAGDSGSGMQSDEMMDHGG